LSESPSLKTIVLTHFLLKGYTSNQLWSINFRC